MKKLFLITFLMLLTVPFISSAHVLKIDGSIGVTIHVNPNDDPIVGQPASFFLEIKDKDNKFNPNDCTCAASISQGDKILYTSGVFMTNADNSLSSEPFFSYTFPAKGVYTFKMEGAPKNGNSFQKFSVSYDLRVERTADSTSSKPNYTNIILIVVGVLAVAIAGFVIFKRK